MAFQRSERGYIDFIYFLPFAFCVLSLDSFSPVCISYKFYNNNNGHVSFVGLEPNVQDFIPVNDLA
jgi:hypothetical protein